MKSEATLKEKLAKAEAECRRLREAIDRLQLSQTIAPQEHDRPARPASPGDNEVPQPLAAVTVDSRPDAKVALFQSLFRGRNDVYAVRWEGKSGKSGYSPAGIREWDPLPSTKPGARKTSRLSTVFSLDDEAIRGHLLGKQTVGLYPLLPDDTCWFVAVDFDKKNWEADACAYLNTCADFAVTASLERSRSGQGGHIWIFFAEPVQAALARRLASCILTRTMERRYALGLDSYDRLFPNQDTMPKGGFGNLIALPLQHGPRKNGNSVFVDSHLRPYEDQWAFLSSIKRISQIDAQEIIRKIYPAGDELNVRHSLSEYDEQDDPWTLPPSGHADIELKIEPIPPNITITVANLIYVEKKDLPDSFVDRLIRLAAFQNPEFYKSQAMRLSTFGKPRVIGCAEDLPRHVGLPRGLLKDVLDLFHKMGVAVDVADQQFAGAPMDADFHGDTRAIQTEAARALAAYDHGILCAPTAFGKTAVAAKMIAFRKVNTLVLVHRRHLMDQWRERLALFLGLDTREIGQIGGGKSAQTGRLDVAVIQSLIRKGEVRDLVADYGQVIVDECHHVSAFSFEQVLKKVKAKFVIGLTATPIRKDGHHPIIFMQCGPIRFNVSSRKQAEASPFQYEVIPRPTEFTVPEEWIGIGIQEVYTALVHDERRTDLIVADVVEAIEDGRSPLLLTERMDHLQLLLEKLRRRVPNVFVMKGGMGKKQRTAVLAEIAAIPADQRRVILATGRYIGEGFDDARLDTLFLGMPISWRGTLQQYVGRLHRQHVDKHIVRVYDYVDACVPVLNRMYERRLNAYKAVGYKITRPSCELERQASLKFATIERIAVAAAIACEQARGCTVESVESDTRGFDLISRRLVSGSIETRFIEVKGRAAVGEIALTANEYKTAQRVGDDYWLYVVFNCASQPKVMFIRNPARFDWEPLSRIDCYRIGAETLLSKSCGLKYPA